GWVICMVKAKRLSYTSKLHSSGVAKTSKRREEGSGGGGHVERCAQKLHEGGKYFLLVEGAGGFYVPLDRRQRLMVADIAGRLGLPLILVAQSGLGAINDTCLSLEAIGQWGLPIAGFVLNDLSPEPSSQYIRDDNPQIISELSGIPCLGTLPYLANPYDASELLGAFSALSGIEILEKYLAEYLIEKGS
ncbi:MAG: ATP-dependent dethiobiotin synthetase BioD, partial [Spirochaetota bacterium]